MKTHLQQENTLNPNHIRRGTATSDHFVKRRHLASILCLATVALVAGFGDSANAVDIGPGFGIANVLNDSAGGRLNVDNFNAVTLGPGTYTAAFFNYDASFASDVTPFLAIATGPGLYNAIAVGTTQNVPGAIQDATVPFGGSATFTLSLPTVVYAGIASLGQNPIPLNQNAGYTDHEGAGQPASSYTVTLGGQVPPDGTFSNPHLGRVYAFSITVLPIPEPSSLMLGLIGCAALLVVVLRRRGPRKIVASAIALAFMFTLLGASSARAQATINWLTPTTISGDSDVSTVGALFGAANFGGTGVPTTTVNGVTFNPFVTTGSTSYTSGNFTLSATNSINGGSSFGSPSNPFAALTLPYQNLLASASFVNNAPLHLTLNNLVINQVYLVQLWVNYSDLTFSSLESVSGGNAPPPVLQYNTTSTVGGVGQFITGTFTATSNTEAITLTEMLNPVYADSIINAAQVRVVPEPSVVGMMGAGISLLLAATRFRRRHL